MSANIAISAFRELPERKDQIEPFADLVVEELMNGYHDVPKWYKRFLILKNTLDRITSSKMVLAHVVDKIENEHGKLQVEDSILSIRNGATYKYDTCGHPRWAELQAAIDVLRSEQKEIEAQLKVTKEPYAIAEGRYAGTIVYPAVKNESQSITLK